MHRLGIRLADREDGLVDHRLQRGLWKLKIGNVTDGGKFGKIVGRHPENCKLGFAALNLGQALFAGRNGDELIVQPLGDVEEHLCRQNNFTRLGNLRVDPRRDSGIKIISEKLHSRSRAAKQNSLQRRNRGMRGNSAADDGRCFAQHVFLAFYFHNQDLPFNRIDRDHI